MNIRYSLICALSFILLISCGGGNSTEANNLNKAPIVIPLPTPVLPTVKPVVVIEQTFPRDQQRNIEVDELITINFSEDILEKDMSFEVHNPSSTKPLNGKLTFLGKQLSFLPNEPFVHASEYMVNISASSTSPFIIDNYTFSFNTIDVPIPTPGLPAVIIEKTFPSDQQENIAVDEAITVNFSEAVLEKDISLEVSKSLSTKPLNGKVTFLDKKLSFVPNDPLEHASEYIVIISARPASSFLIKKYIFSFKTQPFNTKPTGENNAGIFHPLILKSGRTKFSIMPIESVKPGELITISFGIPFPKGFLTNIEQFRIMDEQGDEFEVFAKELLPWRASDQKNESIRSVLVQTEVIFKKDIYGKAISRSFTLEWGTPRKFVNGTLQSPKDTWVLVDDSNYTIQDNIYEPNAYAVFAAQWYGDSVIKTRTLPAGTHQYFSAYDIAFELFGDTAINHVDPRVIDDNLIPHRSSYAAWLFDRATTIYQLAFKTGEFRFLREGHRAVQFYLNHINERGFFALKPYDDIKYSYGESLVTNFILTGDNQIPNIITSMVPAWDTFNSDYKITTNFWTERHAAFQLKGYISAYELTGNLDFKEKAYNTFTNLLKMQNTPVDGVPNTGALMHTSASHGEGGEHFIASPWMSVLLVDAVERFYIQFEEPQVIDFVINLADFFKQDGVSLYEWKGYQGKDSFYVPYYLAGKDLTIKQHGGEGANDLEHGLDVSKIFSIAYYFSCLKNACDDSYLVPLSKLYKTATEFTLPYWMRTAAPGVGLASYRLSPPRKFNWWFNTTSNMDFLLSKASVVNSEPNLIIQNESEFPENYYPGQVIEVKIKIKNLDSITAKNIVVDNKILKYSVSELLTISDISGGGILNVEGVIWHIPELAAGAESTLMSFKVLVGQLPALQSKTKPLGNITSLTNLRYCHYMDSLTVCDLWENYWSQGSQTLSSIAQWSSVKATPPNTPPTVNIVTPIDNDNIVGSTLVLAEIADENDIAKVDFRLDGELIKTHTATPFEYEFNSNALSDNPHTLTVQAWDVFGSFASQSITLNPGNPDTQIPKVNIVSPAANQEYCGPIVIDYEVIDNFAIDSCKLSLDDASVLLPNCGQYVLFPSIPLFSSIAHLTLNELTQSVISQDGFNLVGVPHNIVSENGIDGLAYNFNGVDSNISFTRSELSIYNEITVSFWMNPSRDEGVIISQDWNYIGPEQGWAISLGANNHESNNGLSLTWSSGDYKSNANTKNVVQTPTNSVLLNTWQNVVIRKQNTLVEIFIDGVLITSKDIFSPDIAWPFNSDRQLSIGKGMKHPDMYKQYFKGTLDDVAIWNEALTDIQIAQLYNKDNAVGTYELEISAKDGAGNVGKSNIEFSITSCSN